MVMIASLWGRGMETLFGRKGAEVEIQRPIDEVMESLKPTHDEEMSKEADNLDQKEVENKSDGVEDDEKDVEPELEVSKEDEEYIKNEIKKLDLLKQETISEKEKLQVLTDELEKRTAELSQQKQQIHEEQEKLNVKKELLLREVEDLKQERKVFEVEWEALSLRREALSNPIYPKEIECLSAENGSFEKEKRDIADVNNELVMVREKLKDQLRKFSEKRARFHEFVVDSLKDCENCGYIARHYALSDELLEEGSFHKTNAGRSSTDQTNLKFSELSGGRLSWIKNCRSRIFSLSPKTAKHLSESSLDDKTGVRKRTRAEQTSIMKEADADTRKRRQIVTPSKDPGQHFASYKQIDTQSINTSEQGLDGNADAADFKIMEVIDDAPEYNVEDEHGRILRCDDGDDNSEEEEEEEEEDPGETSMGKKIWNFLTT